MADVGAAALLAQPREARQVFNANPRAFARSARTRAFRPTRTVMASAAVLQAAMRRQLLV
jgi:hypothetical protein